MKMNKISLFLYLTFFGGDGVYIDMATTKVKVQPEVVVALKKE
ncbi:hypothetical protein [Bacteroides heparinolyticus]